MKKYTFFAGVALCLLVAILWFWQAYHKERPMLKTQKADVRIAAAQLYQAFARNEDSANKLYLGKILAVEGRVVSKSIDQRKVAIQIASGDPTGGGINCALRFPKDSTVAIGHLIKIKGRCSGYLMDVNLTDVEIEN